MLLADWCERGVRVVVITQQLDLTGTVGRMVASVLFGLAEIEQEYRRERQAAGIAVAKRNGVYRGRRKGTTKAKPTRAQELRVRGLVVPEIATALEGDPELCQGGIVGEAAVLPSDLQIRKVAEQWVRQLERLRKGLLREGMVGTDPENLDVQLLEFGIIDLPGREVGHSRRGKIDAIELEEDVLLPPKLAEADLVSRRTGEREVRRGLPDPRKVPPHLLGGGHAGDDQDAGEQHTQHHQTSRVLLSRVHISLLLLQRAGTSEVRDALSRSPRSADEAIGPI
jgi:Resolvase, N terminal domain